jgi:hypothetical protein
MAGSLTVVWCGALRLRVVRICPQQVCSHTPAVITLVVEAGEAQERQQCEYVCRYADAAQHSAGTKISSLLHRTPLSHSPICSLPKPYQRSSFDHGCVGYAKRTRIISLPKSQAGREAKRFLRWHRFDTAKSNKYGRFLIVLPNPPHSSDLPFVLSTYRSVNQSTIKASGSPIQFDNCAQCSSPR